MAFHPKYKLCPPLDGLEAKLSLANNSFFFNEIDWIVIVECLYKLYVITESDIK